MLKQISERMRGQLVAADRRRRKRRNIALIDDGVGPPPIEPAWPLPRRLAPECIRAEFAKFDQWHYAYEFAGGPSFQARHNISHALADEAARPLMRFRHFFPWLLDACGGSLDGKTVLDIACNSGFWSIQCALMGAKVVGFDARDELIEQANLLKSITGVENVSFQRLDFWQMKSLGTFDVVLNLGILYHLPEPVAALALTRDAAREIILLDTAISPSIRPVTELRWEEPNDVRNAADSGMVVYPSKSAIEMMLRHLHLTNWREIPLRSSQMPEDYLSDRRASWLIRV